MDQGEKGNYFGAVPFRLFSNGELSVPFLAVLTRSSSLLAPSRASHRFTHYLMIKIQISSLSCSSVRTTANRANRGREWRFIRRVPLHLRGCVVIFLSVLYVCTSANLNVFCKQVVMMDALLLIPPAASFDGITCNRHFTLHQLSYSNMAIYFITSHLRW